MNTRFNLNNLIGDSHTKRNARLDDERKARRAVNLDVGPYARERYIAFEVLKKSLYSHPSGGHAAGQPPPDDAYSASISLERICFISRRVTSRSPTDNR